MTDNTIESLRVNQIGLEAIAAQGAITLGAQPAAGKTFHLGEIVYTFVANGTAASAGDIDRGTTLAECKTNFLAAINGSDLLNDPNPYASASVFTGDISTITARVPGPFGNTIVFTLPTPTAGTSVNGSGTLGATTSGAMARGTAVAATARLAVEQLVWGDEDEKIYHPSVANGLLTRYQRAGTPVQHGTRFSMPDQAAIWDLLPIWFAMTVDGNPTITGPDGNGNFTFTFVSDPTANPNPMAATLERKFDNGLGNTIEERASYCMLDALGLSFAANEQLRLSGAKGFARKFETNSITGALTLPDFEVMVSALSTVYFDDDWASVGNTLVAEEVIGWKWMFLPGIFPRPTAEGRTNLDYTKHQLNGRERGIDLDVQCLLDPTIYAQEKTRASTPATNSLAVQVRVTGSANRLLKIDQMMQHDKPLWQPAVDQGQDVVTYKLKDNTDGANFLRVTLVVPSSTLT